LNWEIPFVKIERQIEIERLYEVTTGKGSDLTSELTRQQDLVKQLRQAFLREAMQGKLVKQDKKDGNAKDLLGRIKTEKEKLIAEKKLKKEKPLPPIKEEEIPFEIPDNWLWCRFQEITALITCGLASTPKYYETGKIFLSAKNVKPFRFIPEEHKFVDEQTYRKITQNAKPELYDILVTRVGAGIGETALIDKEIDFAFYVSLTLIKPMKGFIDSKFLTYFMNSPQGINNAISFTTGKKSSQSNLNVDKVRKFLIPLPPLPEQTRIVKKLEELMNLCDELQSSISSSKEQNELLLQGALRDALRKKEE
jgi:type I restriction enzyme S subunit